MVHRFRVVTAALLMLAVVTAAYGAEEVIVWYDSQGQAHVASSVDEIPPEHRGQASGVLTNLDPAMAKLAAEEGVRIGSDPLLYAGGTGALQPFVFELGGTQRSGYLLVGTKFNMVRAASCEAAHKGKKPDAAYAAKVNGVSGLPIAFYSAQFKPVLMLLMQDDSIIKGDEGFAKETDPGLGVDAYVKTFPYEAVDFSRPARVQLYNREGEMFELKVDLPGYR